MPTSKFVHVGRKDLISNHVGETAIRTGNKIKEAIGGVLFIDEAYSLLPSDDSKDWGNEAINTLTDDLEERHNDLIVILAGYTDKMKEFFDRANPGLKSRFSTWVEFPDYTTKELYLIAQMKLEKQFILSNEVKAYVYKAIENFKNSGVAEGNGRFVRIFTQEITFAQSNRITEAGTFDRKSLETLLPEDINEAYKNLGEQIVARR
jgi:Cdc6-like AAA superfamily ATPase